MTPRSLIKGGVTSKDTLPSPTFSQPATSSTPESNEAVDLTIDVGATAPGVPDSILPLSPVSVGSSDID